jgi:hypothetical protein
MDIVSAAVRLAQAPGGVTRAGPASTAPEFDDRTGARAGNDDLKKGGQAVRNFSRNAAFTRFWRQS